MKKIVLSVTFFAAVLLSSCSNKLTNNTVTDHVKHNKVTDAAGVAEGQDDANSESTADFEPTEEELEHNIDALDIDVDVDKGLPRIDVEVNEMDGYQDDDDKDLETPPR